MSEHCSTSPSSRPRWRRDRCPGSVALIARLGVESTSSPEASEGTDAHTLAALCMMGDEPPRRYIGHSLASGRVVSEDMAEAVQTYLDWVAQHPGELHIEAKWELLDNGGIHVWGTSDLVIDSRFRTLSIVDYKHGQGVFVDVEDNDQLKMYAVMAAYDLDPDLNWDHVELAIVQPRYDSAEPVRTYTAPIEILKEWYSDLFKDVVATQEPDAPLRPSDEACRWCPARPQCPARNAVVEQAIDHMGLMPPEKLPEHQLAWLLAHSKIIKDYLDDAYAYAASQAEQGVVIPGFKLVEQLSNRAWTDEAEAVKMLKRAKVKIDQYAPRKVISPAQAEKIVGKDRVNGYTARVASTKLVPESDKRPAIQPLNVLDLLGD